MIARRAAALACLALLALHLPAAPFGSAFAADSAALGFAEQAQREALHQRLRDALPDAQPPDLDGMVDPERKAWVMETFERMRVNNQLRRDQDRLWGLHQDRAAEARERLTTVPTFGIIGWNAIALFLREACLHPTPSRERFEALAPEGYSVVDRDVHMLGMANPTVKTKGFVLSVTGDEFDDFDGNHPTITMSFDEQGRMAGCRAAWEVMPGRAGLSDAAFEAGRRQLREGGLARALFVLGGIYVNPPPAPGKDSLLESIRLRCPGYWCSGSVWLDTRVPTRLALTINRRPLRDMFSHDAFPAWAPPAGLDRPRPPYVKAQGAGAKSAD